MNRFIFIFFFLSIYSLSASAQENPPVINYPPDIYGADNQNWMLTQATDKTIYIANNKGLLTFNGAQWQLYPSPKETVMRGVKAIDDKIYTGAYMDFGVWEKNINGVLEYSSITDRKELVMVEDEHIWNIEQYKKYVLFQSLDRIYIYDTLTDEFQIIAPEGRVNGLFLVQDQLFYQIRGEGLYTINNGQGVLFNDGTLFKESELINVFEIDGILTGITANQGFCVFDESQLSAWSKIDNQVLQNITVYSAIRRKDGSIVLGTVENGIIQFSNAGTLDYQIKKGSGLSNNTALALFEDIDQNLWIGLDAGIDCVNPHGTFNQYIDVRGALGTIYASAVWKNYVYLGTNQGLFYRKEDSTDSFVRMEGIEGQVWDLSILDNILFCGHNNGTYIIDQEKSRKVSDVEGTWGIKKIPGRDDLLMQGNYSGLYILEKKSGSWQLRNKIVDFVNSSKHFEIVDAQTILVSHEYKGVFQLEVDSAYNRAIEVFKHTSVTTGEHSSLSRLGETIFYANKQGIFFYNAQDEKFELEEESSSIFTSETFVTGKLIEDDDQLWAFTADNLIKITRDKLDGSYATSKIALPATYRNTVEGYETFVRFRESRYLLGTSNGYLIVDTSENDKREYTIYLNEVSVHRLGGAIQLVPKQEEGDFPAKMNNISFSFSVPEYDKFLTTAYSYQLEGLYDKWSPWLERTNMSFENLPYGDYTFRVKARIGDSETVNEASYVFAVARPWFLSNLAIIVYIILTILLFSALNWFYKRYYREQQQRALERSKKDMELKTLESEKQIIQLNNTNLKQDIDARNRELAVSTMNMINKSKTLNMIKNALLKADKIEDLETIVKVVDKTIENQEDWNFFEKAFNHADKDFFRKVKEQHPSLTANDLKLCVYLRLNMSSKEIAPLLNISSRSVEIKRYRLRKKLELERDVNLNDYFINL